MKPDWKDAPEWAQWLAMDDDGSWYWHETKPYIELGYWYSDEAMAEIVSPINWTESLEGRPS